MGSCCVEQGWVFWTPRTVSGIPSTDHQTLRMQSPERSLARCSRSKELHVEHRLRKKHGRGCGNLGRKAPGPRRFGRFVTFKETRTRRCHRRTGTSCGSSVAMKLASDGQVNLSRKSSFTTCWVLPGFGVDAQVSTELESPDSSTTPAQAWWMTPSRAQNRSESMEFIALRCGPGRWSTRLLRPRCELEMVGIWI